MDRAEKYSLKMGTDVVCRILQIDSAAMLKASGLDAFAEGRGDIRVTAKQYFGAWNSIAELTDRPDYITYLGVSIARGPLIPVFFAVSCAPNLETGLMRLTHYKTLLGPTRMRVYWDKDVLRSEFDSADPGLELPPSLAALHLVFFMEQARAVTAHDVRAVSGTLKAPEQERREIAGHLGVLPEHGEVASLCYSREDARRPLVSENPGLWEQFEEDLKAQLAADREGLSVAARVRTSIIGLMSSGRADAENVSLELGISRSTLQRRLHEEGCSFQRLLDRAREDLAIRYLTRSTLKAEEIASLLGYGDANSFSRSFRRWTGTSPTDYRSTTRT